MSPWLTTAKPLLSASTFSCDIAQAVSRDCEGPVKARALARKSVRRLAFSQDLASSYDRDAAPPPAPGPGYLLPCRVYSTVPF